jgi:DNA-binding NtrC family response regulator
MHTTPYTLFIVDDEKSIRDAVAFGLKKRYCVMPFASAEEALDALQEGRPDMILLDIGLPGMSGLEALKEFKLRSPDVLVIIITAAEDIDTVIRAMRAGARDYVVKPLQLDTLRVSIGNALETIALRKEIQALQKRYLKENVPCFIGESDAIQDVMLFVDKVARSHDTPILITGETGTGKELIASAIHYKSPHFRGPFVSINCAAIPRDLLESELFGYEKGAFSGALATGKKGLVEEADNGTLFLDEVGDLSEAAQAKLLRFLQEGQYYRVGGTHPCSITTRVVSATNKNLEQMIEHGRFRQDLYYRLAVIRVDIPSLNQRRADILPIARFFLVEFSRKHGKTFSGLDPSAEAFLEQHHWKGNIRELRNLIERGVLVSDGPVITLADLGLHESARAPATAVAPGALPELPDDGIDLDRLEEHFVREAFRRAGGNETRAARLLNMSYYSFRYKRKKIKDLI